MLKSYFLLAWRNLLRHRTSAFINIGGLALGLTTSILVLLYLNNELGFDRWHRNIAELYLLQKNQRQADGVRTDRTSAGPMADALKAGLPEVEATCREADAWVMKRVGDNPVWMGGMYADTPFFRMMSFPAVAGDPGATLRDPQGIVLTESTAKKLFGDEQAMGKQFIINDSIPVRVGAIVRDVPANSSIQFEFVRPFSSFLARNPWLVKWDDNRILTWIQLKPGANVAAFDRKATKLLQTKSQDTTVTAFAWPMAKLRLYSGFTNGRQTDGRIRSVILTVVLGVLVLLIGCINFMNISTARSEMRAREVGVRKVMGASRKQVMLQMFCEALTIVFLSLAIGILASRMVLPVVNRYIDAPMRFDLLDGRIWAGIVGVGLLTGLLAGCYPALFLSRFRPAKVLKGEVNVGRRRSFFRRVLVTTQFWVAIFFIIGTLVVWDEIDYIRKRPIGYDQENLIDIHTSGELAARYSVLAGALNKLPEVKSVTAGSDDLLNFGAGITGMDWPGKVPGHEVSIFVTTVGYDWIRTTGLHLAQGRDFSRDFGTDTAACLITEVTVQRLGLKEPVLGQKLGGNVIIGVVKNFVFNNPSGIIAPMAIYLYKGAPDAGAHVFVRIADNRPVPNTLADIGGLVKQLDPRNGFDFSFTKQNYFRRFEEFDAIGLLVSIFGGMAIFISCLGLFGLAGFIAERRAKEMSIRKVFGASVRQVLLLLSMDFLRPVFLAFVLAVPAARWGMQVWLDSITYHVPLHWTVFAAAGLIAVVVALLTVGWQGGKTASENPAVKLRNE